MTEVTEEDLKKADPLLCHICNEEIKEGDDFVDVHTNLGLSIYNKGYVKGGLTWNRDTNYAHSHHFTKPLVGSRETTDDLVGKYILNLDERSGHWQILREKKTANLVYEVVIPDAGYNKSFAFALLSTLNSQGSEVGNVASTSD